MAGKHQSADYQRNARVLRQRTRKQLGLGVAVACWRCGGPILPGMAFDVGHIDPNGGHHFTNLAPEHREPVGRCRGNRSHGGTMGAAVAHGIRTDTRARDVTAWPV